MIKEFKFYAHASKDSNRELYQDELELSEEAMDTFKYCGYEIEFDCAVATESGKVLATKVNGVDLQRPIELT